jgi:hypothetical protein
MWKVLGEKMIVLAILAKDKEYCLSFYLNCILKQTVDKKEIALYIRTNDNKDNTEAILKNFIDMYGNDYASVYYDDSSIDDTLTQYEEHEWNSHRFNILGKIRQDSIDYAVSMGADYFTVDCDNFIGPNTLSNLLGDKVVGPLLPLLPEPSYSSFHYKACPLGYYEHTQLQNMIQMGEVKGIIEVDTVHCTYFIPNEILPEVSYDDGTERYEYAIFSDTLRRKGIPQYIDNREFYGFLYLNDQIDTGFPSFIKTYWYDEYIRFIR